MKLSKLAKALVGARLAGTDDPDFLGIAEDSRQIVEGTVFFAIRRLRTDGREFVSDAVKMGAVAVVAEEEIASCSVPMVLVSDAAAAFGQAAAFLYDYPAQKLTTIGITGTNGKTTTSYLLEAILQSAGHRPGIIGTVSYRYAGSEYPAPYTTPTPTILQKTLADMVSKGCTHAIVEVSSAALSMKRLAGMEFDIAAFSNLSQDHLDVHGSMENYRDAKALLFSKGLGQNGTAIINADDPSHGAMALAAKGKTISLVSRSDKAASVFCSNETSTIKGIRATFATKRGEFSAEAPSLLGDYNIENLALAVGVSEALEISQRDIAKGISEMAGVPGRVERVENGAGLDILVDYAHTEDALRRVLAAVKPLTQKRLICVFGCGGDRDKTKREPMGRAVEELSDLPIVTSDNPRTEEPLNIIEDILPGVPSAFFVHPDRRIAIREAVYEATPGDVLVIAGKGHEDYQIIGTEKLDFDDRKEAAAATGLRTSYSSVECSDACEGELLGPSKVFSRIVIDSRIAAPGDLYVAISGENFDGHDFAESAIESGAEGIVGLTAKHTNSFTGHSYIAVSDTRRALGLLAKMHRQNFSGPLVAITGSSGKTTTKELIRAALSPAGPVLATKGSLNNETGVPLTLLGLREFHRYAVLEMGMRNFGDISYLCEFAAPSIGVVTNIGSAHIGVMGSVEKIRRGKAEVFPPGGISILPAGDKGLRSLAAQSSKIISFGVEDNADIRVVDHRSNKLNSEISLAAFGETFLFSIPFIGEHSALNSACAIAVAAAANVPLALAVSGLERARPPSMRGQVMEIGKRQVVVDCYNANPESMKAALRSLHQLAKTNSGTSGIPPVAILGDMLELGDIAPQAHFEIGAFAASHGIHLIAVGDFAGNLQKGAKSTGGTVVACETLEQAAKEAVKQCPEGGFLLLKASRALKLEQLLPIMRDLGEG